MNLLRFPTSFLDFAQLFLIDMETVLIGGEGSLEDLFSIGPESLEHVFTQVNIAFGEFRSKAVEETEHIMDDQHLTVAVNASANSDRRDF